MTELNLETFERLPVRMGRTIVLLAILIAAMALDWAAQDIAHFSSPGLFLLPAIAIIGMYRGMATALAAAATVVIFAALVYGTQSHGSLFHTPWDALARLALLALSAPIIAIVVGLQHKRLEDVTNGRVEQALRKRARELEDLAAALQHSNQELDQFTYVTSHDLKAPLRGISNLSQWIEEDLGERLTPEARQQFGMLRGRVHRMEALINGLLEYAHIGRGEIKPSRVDVGALLAEVIDWVSPPAAMQIRVEPGMPVLNTDKLRLQQVFANLIENSVKHHGKPAGSVVVRCEDESRFFRFAIEDDGPGIEPRYQAQIFSIFQTLAPRDRVEGTGIGLSLVRKIVESKGGQVGVQSAEGEGSTFWFTWPRSQEMLP